MTACLLGLLLPVQAPHDLLRKDLNGEQYIRSSTFQTGRVCTKPSAELAWEQHYITQSLYRKTKVSAMSDFGMNMGSGPQFVTHFIQRFIHERHCQSSFNIALEHCPFTFALVRILRKKPSKHVIWVLTLNLVLGEISKWNTVNMTLTVMCPS